MKLSNSFNIGRYAYRATRSFLRAIGRHKIDDAKKKIVNGKLKVAFIHNEKKLLTGAHQINQIMASALRRDGVQVKNFYPRWQLADAPLHMRGIANILFFHSLLDKKAEIFRSDIVQGTTYTPLPFLSFGKPIVSHFGSTTAGFILNTPKTRLLAPEEISIWRELRKYKVVPEMELKTFRPLQDIMDIEQLVATRVSRCVATSEKVKGELLSMGVLAENVEVIHNSIEDYWFDTQIPDSVASPQIVFLGRLGGDVFTLKLKGLTRLIGLYRRFPEIPKTTICMTTNKKLKEWLKVSFPKHYMYVNLRKDLIPGVLSRLFGSILFVSSRYEGFSLSLVEGMSQGLVPVSYPVGVAPEIIKNGVNGFLVFSNDEAEERIKELLADTNKRLAMADEARMTAGKFRSTAIADKLTKMYQNMLDKR